MTGSGDPAKVSFAKIRQIHQEGNRKKDRKKAIGGRREEERGEEGNRH